MECLMCLGLDLLCSAAGTVPAGFLAAACSWLCLSHQDVLKHVFGGLTCLPALPSLQDGDQQCPELPLLLSLLGWVISSAVRCWEMPGSRDESKISLGTNVKLNKMCVCISQPKPDSAI